MELFTIHCTTCRARLKVNDESAIGDILACPKCGSMVQVVPPVGWKRAGSVTTTVETVVSVSDSFAWPPQGVPGETRPMSGKAALIPPALPGRPASPAGVSIVPAESAATVACRAEPSVAAVVTMPPEIESPTVPAGAPPTANRFSALWSALAARARRDWPILGGGVGGGIVLGAGVWLILALQAPLPPVSEEMVPATLAAVDTPSVAVAAAVVSGPENQSAPAATGGPATPVPSADDHTANVTEKLAPTATPPVEGPSAKSGDKPSAVDLPIAQPAEAAPIAGDKRPAGPTIKLDPAPAAAADPAHSAKRDASKASADDELADDAESAALEPPALAPPAGESAGTARVPLTAAEVDERLSVSVSAIEFKNVTLWAFVEFVGELAGVPISIDEESLGGVGRSRQMKLSIKLADTTAGDALRAAIGKLGLSCEARDGRVVVRAGGEARGAK